MMINYLKSSIWTISILLISSIIVTIFNYFNIISGIPLKITLPLISIFIGSYKLGKLSNQKGYIEGIKYGSIYLIIFLIISIITKSFTYLSIIYYIVLMIISILGSILGINKKREP